MIIAAVQKYVRPLLGPYGWWTMETRPIEGTCLLHWGMRGIPVIESKVNPDHSVTQTVGEAASLNGILLFRLPVSLKEMVEEFAAQVEKVKHG